MVGAARIFADEGESPARPVRAPDANGSLTARTGRGYRAETRRSTCAARLRANGAHRQGRGAAPLPVLCARPMQTGRSLRGRGVAPALKHDARPAPRAYGRTALADRDVGRLPCPACVRARCDQGVAQHAARPATRSCERTALADRDVYAAPARPAPRGLTGNAHSLANGAHMRGRVCGQRRAARSLLRRRRCSSCPACARAPMWAERPH